MPVLPAFWVSPSCLRADLNFNFETLGRWRGRFRRGEGLIGSRGVTPAHLLILSISAVPILSILATLILVLSLSAIFIWVLSLVLFIWIVLVSLILGVLGGIVNNRRLDCNFLYQFRV